MSSPLDLNPTSGGEPAEPSAANTDAEVEAATSMMEQTTITNNPSEEDDEAVEEVEVEILDGEEDDEDDDDMMAMLPSQVRGRVEKLKEFHAAREKIMADYLAERAALENKYAALCEPLYAQRLDVIQGKMDAVIDAEKGASSSAKKPPAQDADDDDDEEDENIVGVPQFWVCAMGHMETVAELVTERDVDCLEHLTNVTCEDFSDGKGFTLKFHFEPNEHFTNTVLTKTYEIPNLLLDDEPILKNVTGCTIQWKDPTKALTHTLVSKKQRSKKGKHAGQIRTVTRPERCDSFSA